MRTFSLPVNAPTRQAACSVHREPHLTVETWTPDSIPRNRPLLPLPCQAAPPTSAPAHQAAAAADSMAASRLPPATLTLKQVSAVLAPRVPRRPPWTVPRSPDCADVGQAGGARGRSPAGSRRPGSRRPAAQPPDGGRHSRALPAEPPG